MANQLKIDRDPTSVATYVRSPSSIIAKARLSATVDTTFTVPAGVSRALFSSEVPFWLSIDSEQVLPTLTIESGSEGELNPCSLQVEVASVLHVKSRSDGDFCVIYYS